MTIGSPDTTTATDGDGDGSDRPSCGCGVLPRYRGVLSDRTGLIGDGYTAIYECPVCAVETESEFGYERRDL